MAQIVRLGDPSSHGGTMITATGNFKVNGIVVCVSGDIHHCPIHQDTPVTGTGQPESNGKPIVKTGDVAGCGAVITSGSSNTFTD